MSSQAPERPPGEIWAVQLRAIRREISTLGERQERILELTNRIANQLNEVRSDQVLLENQNLTRHNEVLRILERLDMAGIPEA